MAAEPYRTSIVVAADRETVFDYFTVPERLVRWMGDFAVLDPRPGGEFTVDVNGMPVRGAFLEVDRPRRLRISWGHAGSERLPPGASTLEVTFTTVDEGTLVSIVHSGLPEPDAKPYAAGWTHYLGRLVVAGAGGDAGPDPYATQTRR